MYLSNRNVNSPIDPSLTVPINQTSSQSPPYYFMSHEIMNPNSKQDQSSLSSFFPFPSPSIQHYEEEELEEEEFFPISLQNFPDDDVFPVPLMEEEEEEEVVVVVDSNKNKDNNHHHHHHHGMEYNTKKSTSTSTSTTSTSTTTVKIPILKRSCSSKKDRHSKINTAHGPRDRRMRLSLEVARMFFDLQDLLGFDRASKTVEWLMTKSKFAIKELAIGFSNMKDTSHITSSECCEVVSGVEEESSVDKKKKKKMKKKKIMAARKSSFCPSARQSREKARERARERTREKRRYLCLEGMNQLGFCKPFEGILSQENLGIREDNVGDHSLVINGNWSPSFMLNYVHHGGTSQEHQSSEFQFHGKQWETYNNINLL